MSNSQEQNLDENVVFLPVTESSPEFLHCERERQAVERLLSAGPEAFYSSIDTERSGCFLSPQEVSQITSWAQDYHISQLQLEKEGNGEEESPQIEDFSSTYFPAFSDTPAPCLELGWPEKGSWVGRGSVTVHTSPPAEGQPHIREIIRRHLQGASQVIAIVTDRLTDGAIIRDLHNAASRGVPVYIILNRRSILENFMLNRLRHPSMHVRVLGGKTFCSKKGRMVVGEMKDKFLLVDLQTVIHGSYSLTWTDAHLHRQLITVLKGPMVEPFDKEFRILFAASLPIPDPRRLDSIQANVTHQLKDFTDLCFSNHLPMEPEVITPPSPPADFPLDWEAMGVVQRENCIPDSPVNHHEEIMTIQRPVNKTSFDTETPMINYVSHNKNRFQDQTSNTQPSPTDSFNLKGTETQKRLECKNELAFSRQLSKERSANSDDRTRRRPGKKGKEETHNMIFFSNQRKEQSKRESILEEEGDSMDEGSKVEHKPSSRKPLILRVPQTESFSSVSDIMRKLQGQQSTPAEHRRGSKAAKSELSRSMMDLSECNMNMNQDERGTSVPRLQASYFDLATVSPGLALMKKRNDEIKSLLYRTPNTFLPSNRPRSFSYGLQTDWRKLPIDKKEAWNEEKL
ncbi:hypothetical protein LDENG_00002300 [Lucifuga dentata]|nr:hypothetical protein LDENG_00002300 [Lucifuga dentata]